MNKKPLTQNNIEAVQYSLKKLMILSQLFNYEYQMYLVDTKFRSPQMNQFASRIGKDTAEIKRLLGGSVRLLETDYAEEFTGVMWRIMDSLCGLELEPLQIFADYLVESLENVGV